MTADEIQRRLEQIETERLRLEEELSDRENQYKSYLKDLVVSDDADSTFKDEVLQWLGPTTRPKEKKTIKEWVVTTIGEQPERLSFDDLKNLFRKDFEPKRLPSLRQYVGDGFGLVTRVKSRLALTEVGKEEFNKLKSDTSLIELPDSLDSLDL